MYQKIGKRAIDLLLSLTALLLLSPLLLILTVFGAVNMRGNPFFLQPRPGYQEKIFCLIKFRTMNYKKDSEGKLLPDKQRITRYGRFLRQTSIDELPELINIIKGDMAIVGPRPLLVKYLPLYNDTQRHRHDVRPGLTGYAQVHGRNNASWNERFLMDVYYVNHISFRGDCKIVVETLKAVFTRNGINSDSNSNVTMTEFTGEAEK